jgi:subfamily B ATP-binding cassette protein MsbA
MAPTLSAMSSLPDLIQRLRRVYRYFVQPLAAWWATLLSVLVVALTEPLIPALLKPLLDSGFQRSELDVWMVPLALLALFGVRGLSVFTGQVCLARVANQGLLRLRVAMFQRLQDADLSLYRQQSSSALGNTLVYEVSNGANLMVNALLTLGRDSLTLLAMVGYLLYLDWRLTLIVALLFPAVALLMKAVARRLYNLTRRNQEATDQLAYVVEEASLAHREIRLHGAQAAELERFTALGRTLDRIVMKTAVAGSALTPITQMMTALALSAVITVALLQSQHNGMTVGGFAAFVTAMLMLVAPIKHLSEITGTISRGLAALERAVDLIENTPVEQGGTHAPAQVQGRLEWQHIGVTYAGSAAPALQDVLLTVEPGETVALVGASGSGKSTLANLLPRFVDPTAGEVRLDGVDLRQWDLATLRRQFALVSQHVVVLNESLAHNVALGETPDRARVLDCLKAAHLSDFVAALPQGIDTLVGHNASQLSGGERQRLAIARALYRQAPVLILDEATSALDNESERAVQEALQTLTRHRTTLVIAHRLSTIEHADRIVVMENGRIIEQGRHHDLLARKGAYAALFQLSAMGAGSAASATTA